MLAVKCGTVVHDVIALSSEVDRTESSPLVAAGDLTLKLNKKCNNLKITSRKHVKYEKSNNDRNFIHFLLLIRNEVNLGVCVRSEDYRLTR